MKRFNWLGFIGLLVLLAGAVIFRSRGELMPWWLSWILGPLLWYLGGGLAIGSLIYRMYSRAEEEEAAPQTEPRTIATTQKETELPMSKVHVLLILAAIMVATTTAQAAPPPASEGQPVFASKCAMCHGQDGAGKTAMGAKLNIQDLRSDAIQKQSDADLAKVIGAGKNKMPAYDGKLSKQQISEVAAYIHSLKK